MRILNLDPEGYSPAALALLESVAPVDGVNLSRPALLERVKNYDALVLRFSHRIDREVIEQATRLKVIATNATGLDHLDLEALTARNIQILSLKNESEFLKTVTATAELTWGLLLSLVRNIPQATQSVCRGEWQREKFVGRELSGKTIGILGLGRVGVQVARMAEAFSMKVLAYDPVPQWNHIHYTSDLSELLPQCDVLSVHVPLSPTTQQLLGPREFEMMRPGSYLLNTSRGAVLDESALLMALQSGKLAGAAIDVLCREQAQELPQNPLVAYARGHRNLLITPHLGGATKDSWEKTELFIARKTVDFLKGAAN